jgi:hypothetical protein
MNDLTDTDTYRQVLFMYPAFNEADYSVLTRASLDDPWTEDRVEFVIWSDFFGSRNLSWTSYNPFPDDRGPELDLNCRHDGTNWNGERGTRFRQSDTRREFYGLPPIRERVEETHRKMICEGTVDGE